jgi:hypothetical protein
MTVSNAPGVVAHSSDYGFEIRKHCAHSALKPQLSRRQAKRMLMKAPPGGFRYLQNVRVQPSLRARSWV